ncbi:MAG: Rne/Rng family ribonuclease [Microthrixaceae bacterium]|nr:Rne/Rng family ribonuclease [Microthrixaceae bacterium]
MTNSEPTKDRPVPPGAPSKPKIGDSIKPPPGDTANTEQPKTPRSDQAPRNRRRRRKGKGGSQQGGSQQGGTQQGGSQQGGERSQNKNKAGSKGGGRNRRRRKGPKPVEVNVADLPAVELDEEQLAKRRGAHRDGKALGRYQMMVHVAGDATHIAVLEGRSLVEHYVARPSDDVYQIHGNIYVGRVENVLPGMEAAFVDIATPKNAVLYRSDITWDPEEHEGLAKGEQPRIEDVLADKQMVLCQVTKNPIAHKGARLTQEVSIPGRFVVFVPNSNTVGISKRLPDQERKRLRKIIDKARPEGHGLIVRTAAEGITAEEIQRDIRQLAIQWNEIAQLAQGQNSPRLIYREPNMAVRMIREEFNADFRSVMIDDADLHAEIRSYAESVAPALAERITYYDADKDPLPMFERYHVAEQVAKALDRKVWLPSGGSLIIESTEALTVIDVNTGKNVGSSSLEETVLDNNLEAAEEIAHQLRLRDIGGIIVIDFVDMEKKANRDQVVKRLKDALARDKTRTQVFPISELGLVEMTRKRIGEGLVESVADRCDTCDGRGLNVPEDLLRG